MSYQDFFKSSVLKLDAFRAVSYFDMVLGMIISFIIGMYIYWIYKKSYRGVVYSYNYNVSFVLMTMITSLIIMTISTNIVLSLGMVGALSIVRFRTAVKDPMDIVYMFWAISTGIATGAKMYPLALGGSLFISLVIIFLSRKKLSGQSYLFIIRHEEEAINDLRVETKKMKMVLKSKTIRKGYTEVTYEVVLKDDNTAFVQRISEINGVSDVSLVNYTGDYAQ